MQVRQRVIKARTHPENTAKLYDILANWDKEDANSSSGSVSQRVIKTRTRADGKAKGIAVRRK